MPGAGRPLSRAEFLKLAARASLFAALGGTRTVRAGSKPMEVSPGTTMIARPIPASGEPLPAIGLGTWNVFNVGDDPAARDRLSEVLRLFFARGAKLIDTSPMYGRAEGVVGDLVAALHARDRTFLATKVWISGREAGIEQMRRSAELLRTRTIDLIQIHNLLDWRTQLATLRRMNEAGEIRYLGITHYTDAALPSLAEIIEREPLDFVQCAYSIDDRAAEARLLPLAAERRVAVLANRPFGSGELFRRVRKAPLPAWAAEFDCASWAELMLKYVISHPAVTCAIPATGDPQHMADNLAAGFGRLPDEAGRRRMVKLWESL
jgi:diketogulonate reductase-like aldo/keto reductase